MLLLFFSFHFLISFGYFVPLTLPCCVTLTSYSVTIISVILLFYIDYFKIKHQWIALATLQNQAMHCICEERCRLNSAAQQSLPRTSGYQPVSGPFCVISFTSCGSASLLLLLVSRVILFMFSHLVFFSPSWSISSIEFLT